MRAVDFAIHTIRPRNLPDQSQTGRITDISIENRVGYNSNQVQEESYTLSHLFLKINNSRQICLIIFLPKAFECRPGRGAKWLYL